MSNVKLQKYDLFAGTDRFGNPEVFKDKQDFGDVYLVKDVDAEIQRLTNELAERDKRIYELECDLEVEKINYNGCLEGLQKANERNAELMVIAATRADKIASLLSAQAGMVMVPVDVYNYWATEFQVAKKMCEHIDSEPDDMLIRFLSAQKEGGK